MTRIKICGLRRKADVEAANRLKPDFIGFVFAPSKRQVTAAQAQKLKQLLHPEIQAVGVFVNEQPKTVAELCNQGIIDIAQLHGDENEAYIDILRQLTAAPIIKSIPVADVLPPVPENANFLLFDTATSQRGGSGQAFNWQVLKHYHSKPYFLAGGLNGGNITEAIVTLHPHAVDVSSGVETGGYKDPEKMERFVQLARAAAQK